MEMTCQANSHNRAAVAMLISDKTDFKGKKKTLLNVEGYLVMIKGESIRKITIINIYAPNN